MTIEAGALRRMAVETSSESSDYFLKKLPVHIDNFTEHIYDHPVLFLAIFIIIGLSSWAIFGRLRSGKWFFQ
jgi:hypothetical protein